MRSVRRRSRAGWKPRGYEAEHLADRQMSAAADAAIWELAVAFAAAIVTKDADFAQRKILGGRGRW